MYKNVIIPISLVIAVALGFFLKKLHHDNLIYDYSDCMINCDMNLNAARESFNRCIQGLPDIPSACVNVPPEEFGNCIQGATNDYRLALMKCDSIFDSELRSYNECKKKCNYLLDIFTKAK